jgi:hypothetical protein
MADRPRTDTDWIFTDENRVNRGIEGRRQLAAGLEPVERQATPVRMATKERRERKGRNRVPSPDPRL